MPIAVSKRMVEAITEGSFTSGYVATLTVDGQVMLTDVELTGELVSDSGSLVLTQGSLTLNYTDDEGRSIVPTETTSWLTPYASFLDISYRVSNSIFTETVLRGRLKVIGVGDPQERKIRFQGQMITVGSSVSVSVADAFHTTDEEEFEGPVSPTYMNSAWAELAHLTLLPVSRSVPDVSIPRSVLYDENRLDAVGAIGDLLGGIPYMTPAGEVSVAPLTWGDTVLTIGMGPGGTASKIGTDALTDAGIKNKVIVTSWDDDQATILATAQITSGPLRWGGGLGRRAHKMSREFVTTQAQAQVLADSTLPQVSQVKAISYSIQCAPDPRVEAWDVIEFEKDGATMRGRVTKITLPHRGQMTLIASVISG